LIDIRLYGTMCLKRKSVLLLTCQVHNVEHVDVFGCDY